ncbi:MAG: MobF family relaxase, partial [Gammaproteobacteria bacterium]
MLQITKLTGSSHSQLTASCNYLDERGNENQRGRDPYGEPVGALEKISDYYQKDGRDPDADLTPSAWLGDPAALRQLGLEPGAPALRSERMELMQGFNPRTGESLVQNAGPDRCYAWDLTFNAPKSVSSVWARADAGQREIIERAHDHAVKSAITRGGDHLYARRGHGGSEIERNVGYVGAAFRHAEARPVTQPDGKQLIAPHLHSHVQLMNIAHRADGTWGAQGTHELFQAKMELGATYQAELASALRQAGYAIERDPRTHVFRLAEVPRELEKADSPRRGEIETLMREKGWSGGRKAKYASLMTREAKEIPPLAELRAGWAETARSVVPGFDPRALVHDTNSPAPVYDRQALIEAMSGSKSALSETELRAAAYRAASFQGLDPGAADRSIADAIRAGEIVQLREKGVEAGPVFYSTRATVELEERMVAEARSMAGSTLAPVLPEARAPEARAPEACAPGTRLSVLDGWEKQTGITLTRDQRAAVAHITKGAGLALVEGLPGTGKSTALEAARAVWESRGYAVFGLAPTGRAAEELGKALPGSQTLASAQAQAHSGRGPLSMRGGVWVCDEAGTIGSRDMAVLIAQARENGTALVLVGDSRQLQPVAAGGAFKAIQADVGAARLSTIIRQRDVAEREMVKGLSDGKIREAFDHLEREGRVHLADDRLRAVTTAVETWAKHYDPATPAASLIMAGDNASAIALNAGARAYLQEAGLLSRQEAQFEVVDRNGIERPLDLAKGDRITFRENDPALGVTNGMSGTVSRIGQPDEAGQRWVSVRTDAGRTVQFTPDEAKLPGAQEPYRNIEHGYARTVHISQGATAGHVVFAALGSKSAELTNVALSRHREGVDVVFSKDAITQAQAELAGTAPTKPMLEFASDLARERKLELPESARTDFQSCR